MAVDRDYTEETLSKLSEAIEWYYDEANILEKFCSKIKGTVRDIFNIDVDGEYNSYVAALAKDRASVVRKVTNILNAIADVEDNYTGKTRFSVDELAAHNRVMEKFVSCISLNDFSKSYSFKTFEDSLQIDYMKTIEAKANRILEKSVSEWTEEDIEIVSYCYLYCNDSAMKERILSALYEEKQYEFKDNFQNINDDFTQQQNNMYGQKLYVRNEDVANKFITCIDYYMIDAYQRYLNGELSNEEIDRILCNYYDGVYALETSNYEMLWSKDGTPVQVSSDGHVTVHVSKDMQIKENGNGTYEVNGSTFTSGTVEKTHGVVYIKNGEEAEKYINAELDEKHLSDSSADEVRNRVFKKIKSKTIGIMDKVLPGSGDIISTAEKISDRQNGDKAQQKYFTQTDVREYCSHTGMKVIETSEGYTVLPTPNSEAVLKELFEFFEEDDNREKYESFYKSFIKDKSVVSFSNGEIDMEDFASYMRLYRGNDNDELLSILDGKAS